MANDFGLGGLEIVGLVTLLLSLAALVFMVLWPWLILAAAKKMADSQHTIAASLVPAKGQGDVSQSLHALQYQMGRIATAMERIAENLNPEPKP